MKNAILAAAACAALSATAAEIRFTPQDDPATFAAKVRALKAAHPGEAVTVKLAEGEYFLREPFRLAPEDGGSPAAPVTWRGEGAGAVFSGGTRLAGWKEEADGTWSADLPVAEKRREGSGEFNVYLFFEELFVNGRRASRARLPDAGYLVVDGMKRNADRYIHANTLETVALKFKAGDIDKLKGMPPEDVPYAQILMNHNWDRTRRPLQLVLDETDTVVTAGKRMAPWCNMKKGDLCAFENVRAAFDAPGEWFYDAAAGKARYRPLPGEKLAESVFVAPVRLETLVEIAGAPRAEPPRYVDDVTFENVEFAYSAPNADTHKGPSTVSATQSSVGSCSATVVADGARRVAFRGCRFRHTGSYALWLREGCKGCAAEKCEMTDLGAGGVRIGTLGLAPGAPRPDGAVPFNVPCATSTESNRVDNCIIRHGGRYHTSGAGVIVTHAADNAVTHNEISDFYYTGVSVGWVWGYAGSVAQRNLVAYNHIHHLGQGALADMGGVYTLGTSFGTRVANNVIHDIDSYSYGGWGLYPDEGSEGQVWENNLVYDTKDASFHQHYGRNNILRNNILCYSRQGQVAVSRPENHRSMSVENNIIYWDEGQTFQKYHGTTSEKAKIDWKGNLWWKEKGEMEFNGKSFAEWQAKGNDADGAVADPKFADAKNRDFRLLPDSPALKMGFRPFDPSEAGVYGDEAWKRKARE